jgi:eukaryotic-like serine/threonine-protein kinase
MSLTPGSRLGPYEVLGPIGAGGMGEVYRCRDTRLDRTVAIKVLPAHLASKPELRQRLEREAKAISSLNHPHICTLHDVGREGDTDFLVMEFLEGETLADRLAKGPLPPDQLLRYAVEIADALDKAHRNGVTHRDLKPGNVMITKNGTKLLDFGLAKSTEPQDELSAATMTKAAPLTQQGTILGTFQYMAPEQLEGREADTRSDIHAFGAMLFEMATGRRAFAGKSQASLIVSIMESEPPAPSTISPLSPPALDRVVKVCLAKDPDERWQTAHDLKLQLAWIAEGGSLAGSMAGLPAPVIARHKFRESASWGAAAALLLALLGLGWIHFRETPARPHVVQFTVVAAEKSTPASYDFPLVSPDGKFLVLGGRQGDADLLWIRPLNSLTFQPLHGTDGAYFPFWSPDSQWIAFFANGKLMKIPVTGGTPQTICDAPSGRGGAWADKGPNNPGLIIFSPEGIGQGLLQVSSAGGEAKPFTKLNASRSETSHRWPQFLPDGRVLYFSNASKTEHQGAYVVSADGQSAKFVLRLDASAFYAQGHLLFLRLETLMAQPFDSKAWELRGVAVPLAERVGANNANGGLFSASPNGILTYRGGGSQRLQLTWFDRDGRFSGVAGDVGEFTNPALSPDGKRLAVCRMDAKLRTRDIWILDLERGTSSRLTFDPADDTNPAWSSDGSKIIFTSDRKKNRDIYQKSTNGLGDDELVYASELQKNVDDWSADGRYVVYDTNANAGVFALPLFGEGKPGDRKPIQIVSGRNAQFSPDGRWISYSSAESGRQEVYVQSFPQPTGKWQVSNKGGTEATWRRDGKEMYYLESGRMMAVDVKATATGFEAGIPKVLFDSHAAPAQGKNHFVVAPDGKRFLVLTSPSEGNSSPMVVMMNWAESLGKK